MVASGDSAALAGGSSRHACGRVEIAVGCCSGSQVGISSRGFASPHSLSLLANLSSEELFAEREPRFASWILKGCQGCSVRVSSRNRCRSNGETLNLVFGLGLLAGDAIGSKDQAQSACLPKASTPETSASVLSAIPH